MAAKFLAGMAALCVPFSGAAGAERWQEIVVNASGGSVVSVLPQTGGNKPAANLQEPEGTGVAIGDGSRILTADHVLGAANRILIRLEDGSVQEARVVLRDSMSDLALLEPGTPLPGLEIGEDPAPGNEVCVYGNAFGLGHSLSCGIVSAAGKRGIGFNYLEDFIQTDAAVNPGMSGAPLLDSSGKLAGLVTAIFTKQSDGNLGVNFASSPRLLRAFLKDAEDGRIDRQRPGVVMRPAPPRGETGRAGGQVMQVQTNSAEEKAGLKPGDVIIRAGEIEVRGQADYITAQMLALHGSNGEDGGTGQMALRVTYVRNGDEAVVLVSVGGNQ